MALRDDALNYLRQVFGRERAERDRAESPSAEAEKHLPSSIFSVWGREDVGGLLSVSQNLMDRYADYEQMDDYPDINCLTADTLVYVVEGSIIKPFRLHDLAAHGGGVEILAYDAEKQRLIKVPAGNPRVTGNKQDVVEVGFSNGEKIKCTSNHKFLTVEHDYINASDLIEGTAVVSMWAGFDTKGMSTFLHPITGTLSVTQAATPAGQEDVYDVTTKTHNFIANGIVVHNSAHHYFTNDATQPDIDTGKTVWVTSTDEAIKDMTDFLLNKRLRIEDDIWSMVYSTVKMGNNYEEVLVTENGVVGLNSLPCPTMRRVEQSNGAIIGYVQDITGKFTQDAADLRGMLAGQTKIPDHVALFEEWQILHSRLRGTVRRCPYGYGVADGARWIWKRLVLLEDAMLIYKLCLRGDSQIWTPGGHKAIKDLEEGDEVYSFGHDGRLHQTRVVYKKNNGPDQLYGIKSKRFELHANRTHPVLTHVSGDSLEYVEVQNLIPGVHHLVAPHRPDSGFDIEPILSVEQENIEDVWDIGVEAEEHNFIADGVVVHNTRAPARFAFYIDVTDIPSDKVDSFLRKTKQDLRKQKMVNPRCLTGETPVTCLDGKDRSMRELAEEVPKLAAEGKHHYVFSYDVERNRVVPGKIVGAALSGKKKAVFRVVLDSGAIVRCTGDHPFLLRNGTYKQTQDLGRGESLMPLYLSRGSKGKQWYWSLKDTGMGKVRYAHQMVAEELLDPDYKSKGLHVHHKDENKENNHPSNLELLTPGEHAGGRHPVHLQAARKALKERAQTDPVFKKELYERIRSWRAENPEGLSDANRKASATKTERADEQYNLIFAMVEQKLHNDPTITSQDMVAWLNGQEDFARVYASISTTINVSMSRGCWTALLKRRGFKSFAEFKERVVGISSRKNGPQKNKQRRLVGAAKLNHTVVSVTPDGFEDVYDLTVEKYHNFGLTAGVFVHNTQRLDMRMNPMDNMQDFFIAVRENRELARVEVLQGPDYQATEDVEYFQRKLHGVLKVPRSYLGQDDAVPARSILSFEDVRAARVTMGIQREMKNMIRRLIMIDLAARGINPFQNDLQVMMTVPSGIYELAHNEIKNARADFATRVQPFVSMRYIQERVLKLSEDEIEKIQKEREEDMKREAEQQKLMGDAGGGGGGDGSPSPLGDMPHEGGLQHPGNVEIGPPPGVGGRPNTATEWKRYDAARRLEERRDQESRRRDQEIQDLQKKVKSQSKVIASTMHQHESFIREFKSTYMSRNNNGKLITPPVGRGHRR